MEIKARLLIIGMQQPLRISYLALSFYFAR